MAESPKTLASGTWKITKVADQVRDWKGQSGGEMKSYRIDVESGDKKFDRVELAQRAETAAPTVGQELEGDVTQRQYGDPPKNDLKFKKASKFGGGGGGRRSYPEDDPRVYASKQAVIARQSSIDRAVSFLTARGALADDSATDEELLERVETVAARVHGMVNTAAAEAFSRRGGKCPICGAEHTKGEATNG